ncbi:MAG: S8 family serine peptidase [Rubrivivax sp.]|nr:S8 family serine peptidase [Rubrivivax sp.]
MMITTNRRLRLSAAALACLLLAATLAAPTPALAQAPQPAAQPPASTPATPATRTPITSADQLPRRSYTLSRLPSEWLDAPLAELMPMADMLERDIRADLARYDIQDNATLRGIEQALASLALLRGQWDALPPIAQRLRTLQDKPALRTSTGVLLEILAEARSGGGDAAAQAARVTALVNQRYGALPWADAQETVQGLKTQMETANRAIIVGAFQANLDTIARNGQMSVPAGVVAGIIGARAQLEQVFPLREAILAGITPVVERQRAAQSPRVDRWSARLAELSPTERATPVTVAIWDSGIDMALFQPAAARGLAFNDRGLPVPDLLRPLGEAQARWPQLRSIAKGSLDLQAGLDSEDARRLRQTLAALKPEQVKGFQEDAALVSLYVHGTHVGGIAVAGNPFARVYPVAMHFGHTFPPVKPSAELSQRIAANYRTIVEGMKAAGVRVVNMSWRYSPGAYEAMLAVHGVGPDADARRRAARELFAVERDALKAAFESAPEILFVAGSGNENNSADFSEYIPGGFELPNLITVGATDMTGEETSFSTFGRTVVVHANGFEVDSLIPGGERMKISGASMAAPQVTNLAAKMLALDPRLTPVQLKQMILAGAERQGRVNLIHPKATLAALRARAG